MSTICSATSEARIEVMVFGDPPPHLWYLTWCLIFAIVYGLIWAIRK